MQNRGVEDVVPGQRGVPRVELTVAPLKDQRSHRFWIIPPDFLGYGAKELEGRDHAFEDRLGALEGERQHEGGVGVGPGGDEEGDELAAVGEVDVDVAEIGFEALAREMTQGDERLLLAASVPEHVALHLGIPAGVVLFVAEAAKDLRGGVPLLGRGGFVVDQDLVDDRLEGAEFRRGAIPARRNRLGMVEGLPDGDPGEVELPGDLADGLAIAPRPPNGTVRGRDCPCGQPPAQIRTSGITAYGSYFGCLA
jgi:hypothetical protein